MEDLIIRRAQISDLYEMQQLFVNTITEVCSTDYTEQQLTAWAASIENLDRWKRLILRQYSVVAELDNVIVGLAALDNDDYLDFLYVHKNYQRLGIANRLFDAVKLESLRLGQYKLTSDVSITARPFFESKGFEVVKENRKEVRGVELINYRIKEN